MIEIVKWSRRRLYSDGIADLPGRVFRHTQAS